MVKHLIGRLSALHASASPRGKRTALGVSVCLLFQISGGAQQSRRASDAEVGSVTLERPSAQAPHAYFEALAARSDRLGAYSLRNQAELDALVRRKPSVFWKYVYGSDRYSRAQDGAKLFKPPRARFSEYSELAEYGTRGDEGVHGNRALRFPLGVKSGSMVITWDFWWGEEFQRNRGPVDQFKTFAVATGADTGGDDLYWMLRDALGRYRGRSMQGDEVSMHHETIDLPHSKLDPNAPGVIDDDPFQPTGLGAAPTRGFITRSNVWTRYWIEIRTSVPGREFSEWSQHALNGAPLEGTWDMCSLWIADEGREAARVLYRVPISPKDAGLMFSHFRFAFDTSTNNSRGPEFGAAGPLVAYARNVVVLHNTRVVEPPHLAGNGLPQLLQIPKNVRVVR